MAILDPVKLTMKMKHRPRRGGQGSGCGFPVSLKKGGTEETFASSFVRAAVARQGSQDVSHPSLYIVNLWAPIAL